MPKRLRHYQCLDCGRETHRVRSSTQNRICVDCGLLRAEQAARDMFYKQGPAWEAHQRALRERGLAP